MLVSEVQQEAGKSQVKFANLANYCFCYHSAQVFTQQCVIALNNEVRNFKSMSIQLFPQLFYTDLVVTLCFNFNILKSLCKLNTFKHFNKDVNYFQMCEGTGVTIFSIILSWGIPEMTTLKKWP